MSSQPTPKPLTETDPLWPDERAVVEHWRSAVKEFHAMGHHNYHPSWRESVQIIDRLVALRRAESAALRAAVAEAGKQRDEAQVLFSDERYSHAKTLRLLSDTSVARDALAAELDAAKEALELLHSVQNGAPLYKYEADWNKAMEMTAKILWPEDTSRDARGGGGE